MQLREFSEVFNKIPLSGSVNRYLQNAKIGNIIIKSNEKIMYMDIMLPQVIDEAVITEFKKDICRSFPYLYDVDIRILYNITDGEFGHILTQYWDNILYAVEKQSLLCSVILKHCRPKFDNTNKKLSVSVQQNASFLFKKKGIGQLIEQLISERFNLLLRVEFIEDENLLPKEPPGFERFYNMARNNISAPAQAPAPKEKKEPKNPNNTKHNNPAPQNPYPKKRGGRRDVVFLPNLKGAVTLLSEELEPDDEILIDGMIFNVEKRETKSGKFLFSLYITDGTGSVTVKFFIEPENFKGDFEAFIKKGSAVKVYGKVQYDEFAKEINITAKEFAPGAYKKSERMDTYEGERRVELHLHTLMSKMDATASASDYIKRAKEWGHKAIAITDHGVVQAFPEAMSAAQKNGIKILYGTEAYLVDDIGAIVSMPGNKTLNGSFVIFDIETTGLDKNTCEIIEIGAVKVANGEIISTFSTFISTSSLLPENIVELTGITDNMLKGAPGVNTALKAFLDFSEGCTLVAHNAKFDIGFISAAAKKAGYQFNSTVFCTLEASRMLLKGLQSHKLDKVCKFLGIPLQNHHRAIDDATATAHIFIKLRQTLLDRGIITLSGINALAGEEMDIRKTKYFHAVIFAKNMVGLRNLYELISISHIKYYFKRPRIPKSLYLKFKEGLFIGTACESGEFYKAVCDGAPEEAIRELAHFYDYFEIQPIENNMYLYREGKVGSVQDLININKAIVEYGDIYNKPVVATCDAHFIDPGDEVYRRIIMAGEGFKGTDSQPPLFYRTTNEMLKEFSYLGEEKAKETVIKNTNLIASWCEEIKPIPDGTFPPVIPGADEDIREMTIKKATELYGDPLPRIVAERLDRELTSIIKNGFAVMYIIAQKLVKNSVENGYLVGSRGSVGSSIVATMADITEVNPLPPHYYCPECKYTDFDSPEVQAFSGASGCDMPDRECPRCGKMLKKDGHDIPFETFLGFDGDKEPDIDLNFSGEYQAKAHAFTEELFGTGFVFKAGTIGTLAEKTAFGYIKKYMDERGFNQRNAEISRLVSGLTGIKRTTGQHPGGLMVVPNNHNIYEFTPVQRPADDPGSDVVTTHFDYHAMKGRLLKLDILGHDVPTIIRMLHDITGLDPRVADLGDKEVISLFTSPKALGVTEDEIQCKTGSLGLPEFGTAFVRQMLLDTKPTTFAELVRISGLSHGTDVWLNNAQDLVRSGLATLKEIIPTRDDIMLYLIRNGVEKKASFKIMEKVRSGKGLTNEEIQTLEQSGIPGWYIKSCQKIQYLFPKGHAVAYVMMTMRIGYFKIHHPYAFYAASFSVKSEDFDYELMCKGIQVAKNELKRIISLGKEATAKEKNTQILLELVIEMYARGLKFVPMDLYKSSAKKFIVTSDGLMPPLCAMQGLGANAAQSIVDAREYGEFISIEDFRERTKITKTVIELLKNNRILAKIPETNQLDLFSII